MASARTIKKWFLIHKWTSLICTLFLLELCITGLPLVFGEEIEDWLSPSKPYAVVPPDAPRANLDNLAALSLQRSNKRMITSVFVDDEEPQVIFYMATSWEEEMKPRSDSTSWIKYDAYTGEILDEQKPDGERSESFIDIMLSLHRDLFAGLPGELFLGLMGLLFAAAIVSGLVLYSPFMKKLNFGAVRYGRSKRLKWLDLHNLTGIVAMAWMMVVGLTGVLNELSTPLFSIWQMTDVQKMLAPYEGKPVPKATELSSIEAAYNTVQKAVPDMTVVSIVYPGASFGSPQHYLLWAKGNTPLRSRLYNPALVDARTGSLQSVLSMPWYLRALEVSRPLHFGDYGGLPLKIIWALFDVVAIVVLVSGVYLWFSQRRSRDNWLQNLLKSDIFQQQYDEQKQ